MLSDRSKANNLGFSSLSRARRSGFLDGEGLADVRAVRVHLIMTCF